MNWVKFFHAGLSVVGTLLILTVAVVMLAVMLGLRGSLSEAQMNAAFGVGMVATVMILIGAINVSVDREIESMMDRSVGRGKA